MEKVVFSPEDINQVESLAAGMSVEQVAHYFGISKTTFYEVAKRQPELLERYKQGKAKRIAHYVSADATLKDVILSVRADEGEHRDENHGMAGGHGLKMHSKGQLISES